MNLISYVFILELIKNLINCFQIKHQDLKVKHLKMLVHLTYQVILIDYQLLNLIIIHYYLH